MTTTSHDLAGILRAILEDPADNLPRLAYADLCDEQGDSARAEIIRIQLTLTEIAAQECLQCHEARHGRQHTNGPCRCTPRWKELDRRETELLRANGEAWALRLFDSKSWMRRGFMDRIACTLGDLLEHHKAVFAEHPITRVKLLVDVREPDVRLLVPVTVDVTSMADGTAQYLCHWDATTLSHAGRHHDLLIPARLESDLSAMQEHLCTMADYSLMPAGQACAMMDTLVANWCREQTGLPAIPLP